MERSGGVGALVEGWTGGRGLVSGTGGAASVGGVIDGIGAIGEAGGWEGGCLGKFSWKDCWSSLVMWSVREVRSSSRIWFKYCCGVSDGVVVEVDDEGRIWMGLDGLDEGDMWVGKD